MKTESVAKAGAGSKHTGGTNQLRLGRLLVQRLYICLKNVRIYDTANVAVREAAEHVAQTLRTIHTIEGRIKLGMPYDFLVLNEYRLRPDVTGYGTFDFLIQEMRRQKVGAIHFSKPPEAEEVIRFCSEFLAVVPDGKNAFEEISKRLQGADLQAISIDEFVDLPDRMREAHLSKEIKQRSVDAFFQSIEVSKQILKTADPKRIDFRRAKRVIQKMVDTITEEEFILLSLATIKNYDQYTFNHSANVAVYSIAIGQRVGLSRPALSEVGMAGLFHDLGKTLIPKEILNKPSMLEEAEWEVMKDHSVLGAEILLKSRRLNDGVMRNILVAFEHHLNVDLGGYPKVRDYRDLNLYSKIVAIADCFDALTTPRVYRNTSYSPQEALAIMLEGRGSVYDPVLLKIFVNCLGLHPVGSLVRIDTGEMAVVCRPRSSGTVGLPLIKVFADENGQPVPYRFLDLSRSTSDGKPAAEIVATVDPGDYFESIEDYLEVL